MASIAARDARIVVQVRAILKALVALGEEGASGATLFGDANKQSWVPRLMRRLQDRGLARSFVGRRQTAHGPMHVTWYAALDGLDAAIQDDTAVSLLLWPPPEQYRPAEPGSEEDEGDDPGDEGDEDPGEPPTDREIMEATLKLCSAMADSLAGVRGELQALTKKMETLEQAWS